ncbi:MAG: hypothetical protein VKJ66_03880 [Synechococcus sp.]|nr:hypothetical protein [Synechococcus sp.]
MEPARMLVVRYRGFVLLPQGDNWLVRPERSPMRILPFRVPGSCLDVVKQRVDERLSPRRGVAADYAEAA